MTSSPFNSSTPQLLNPSTPQLLNSSTPQLFNSSTLQPFNSSTLQLLNSSTPQPLNPSTPQPLNPSTLQLLNPSTPQPFNKKAPFPTLFYFNILNQIFFFTSHRTPHAARLLTKRLIPERAFECRLIITFAVNPFAPAPWRRRFRMRFHHQGYRPVQGYFNNLRFNILSFWQHPLLYELQFQ